MKFFNLLEMLVAIRFRCCWIYFEKKESCWRFTNKGFSLLFLINSIVLGGAT